MLADLLAFLIQPLDDFHETQRSDRRRQGNESVTFWERSGGDPDRDQSGNPDLNFGLYFWLRLDALAELFSL